MITKPMLAGKLDSEDQIKFPVLATPKLDGIRCLVIDGHAVTRKFKPVPNKFIRAKIEHYCPNGFDGEIMSGKAEFNDLQSKVMSIEGEPEFEYHVFDYVKESLGAKYEQRMVHLALECDRIGANFIKPVIPKLIETCGDLLYAETQFLKDGYEGIIVRSLDSPYKCGRSTIREGYLLKLKRFQDSEAKILGLENLLHNANEKEIDELGHTKRSKKKAHLQPTDKLGAFVVQDLTTGAEFRVSTGMTDEQRLKYWEDGTKLVGKILKYKYQAEGMKNLPRFPVFIGFRDPLDM